MNTETLTKTSGATVPELDAAEARVLACLIEKEATTPDQYPLTANATQVACNQKTARDPVLDLDAGTVGHALRTLEDKGLVRVIHGSRALRYDHRTDDVYAISPEQRIVLALLMLRGPQTASELLARSERMHRFADLDALRAVLDRLSTRSTPLVKRLPRGGGQREDRYAHLLCGEAAIPAITPSPASTVPARVGDDETLVERVARLESQVDELREAIARLQRTTEPPV